MILTELCFGGTDTKIQLKKRSGSKEERMVGKYA